MKFEKETHAKAVQMRTANCQIELGGKAITATLLPDGPQPVAESKLILDCNLNSRTAEEETTSPSHKVGQRQLYLKKNILVFVDFFVYI